MPSTVHVVRANLDDPRHQTAILEIVGFSTFAARPLVNIHDLHVRPDAQGQGAGRRLMDAVEAEARARGCCKLTLEVQENNHRARALYEGLGFTGAQYEAAAGAVLFRQKAL